VEKADMKNLAKAGASVVVGLVMFNTLVNISSRFGPLNKILTGKALG
jgi:hypothetical protein